LPKATPTPGISTENLSVEQSASGDTLASLNQTYFLIVLRRLEENFKPPFNRAGVTCRVSFRILKDGTLDNPRIVGGTESEGRGLGIYAIQAVEKTGRVPPLYEGIRENYLDVVVTFYFYPKD
jgi:membrane protein involved in colicin uptake